MPLSTRFRNLVEVVITFTFQRVETRHNGTTAAQVHRLQHHARVLSILPRKGRRFRLRSRLTRVAPPLRRLNRGLNISWSALSIRRKLPDPMLYNSRSTPLAEKNE